MFGSRESERKKRERRERREKIKAKLKNKTLFTKAVNLQDFSFFPKSMIRLQNKRGLYRPPQYMKIPKIPINLAKLKDKDVIHQV